MTRRPSYLLLLPLCLALSPSAHADGLLIGRNSDNQLIPILEFTGVLDIPRSVFPGFPGYAQPYPGFGSLTISTPALNQFIILPSANIELRVVAIDPGLNIQNRTSNGFLAAGDVYHLGNPFFDYHPLWNIPVAATPPAPAQMFNVTLIIRDRNNVYTDSAPFTITVTPAPCPADFTNNGTINTADLVHFLARFGQSVTPGQPNSECDLNNDGTVNTPDLTAFLAAFGTPCP
ncbi:MAG: GC-type dockerin domain-anchored protein [Phycisphaerales bacterium]